MTAPTATVSGSHLSEASNDAMRWNDRFMEVLSAIHGPVDTGVNDSARVAFAQTLSEFEQQAARALSAPVATPEPSTDLEWLHLPEILGKFVDYAEKPVDSNALRIMRAVTERATPNAGELDSLRAECKRLRDALEGCLPFIDDADDIQQFFPDSSAGTACRSAIAAARAALAATKGAAS